MKKDDEKLKLPFYAEALFNQCRHSLQLILYWPSLSAAPSWILINSIRAFSVLGITELYICIPMVSIHYIKWRKMMRNQNFCFTKRLFWFSTSATNLCWQSFSATPFRVFINSVCLSSLSLNITINCVFVLPHPRRPRGSQSGREKMRHESLQAWAKQPLGTDSHRTISKWSSECWLLIGHKKALYYCAQSPNSISWVLFVSSYTTATILPHLPYSLTKPS